jgi:hypothetical protein
MTGIRTLGKPITQEIIVMSRLAGFFRDPKAVSKALRIAAAVIMMVAQIIVICMG